MHQAAATCTSPLHSLTVVIIEMQLFSSHMQLRVRAVLLYFQSLESSTIQIKQWKETSGELHCSIWIDRKINISGDDIAQESGRKINLGRKNVQAAINLIGMAGHWLPVLNMLIFFVSSIFLHSSFEAMLTLEAHAFGCQSPTSFWLAIPPASGHQLIVFVLVDSEQRPSSSFICQTAVSISNF